MGLCAVSDSIHCFGPAGPHWVERAGAGAADGFARNVARISASVHDGVGAQMPCPLVKRVRM